MRKINPFLFKTVVMYATSKLRAIAENCVEL
jgi:hypothetical protein